MKESDVIEEMNRSLEELIQVATQLRDLSQQVIAEEELIPLQNRQEELLVHLEEVDRRLQGEYGRELEATPREHFHHQLHLFQELNRELIHNLTLSSGLIQFDLQRPQGEEEILS